MLDSIFIWHYKYFEIVFWCAILNILPFCEIVKTVIT